MSLRARLTLFFVAIVVLPVAVATTYGWSAVARASERQVRSELDLSRRSAMLVLAAQLEQAADAVRSVARDPALQRALVARDRARLQAVLDRERATDLLLAVTDPGGRVLALAGRTEPSFLPGVATPGPRELLAPRPAGQRWAMLQRRTATVARRGCPSRSKPESTARMMVEASALPV